MRGVCVIALGAALASGTYGQGTSTAARDAQAITLLSQSLAAMTKGVVIQDMTLTGQVTRTAGSSVDTGPAVLEAGGYDKTRLTLKFTSGQRLEIRNATAGAWSGADAVNHAIALHNTWTAAAWFAPALVVQSWIEDTSFSLSYVGLESRGASQVQHIHAARIIANATDVPALSGMDLYLDSQSLLPLALDYTTHPDDDLRTNLPVEVTYASYQSANGMAAPSRIQMLLQNSLLLDLSVAATTANTGIPGSDFLVP